MGLLKLQSIYNSLHAASSDIPAFFLVRESSSSPGNYETAPITMFNSFLGNVAPEKV
jgi:hypothetical protein